MFIFIWEIRRENTFHVNHACRGNGKTTKYMICVGDTMQDVS